MLDGSVTSASTRIRPPHAAALASTRPFHPGPSQTNLPLLVLLFRLQAVYETWPPHIGSLRQLAHERRGLDLCVKLVAFASPRGFHAATNERR